MRGHTPLAYGNVHVVFPGMGVVTTVVCVFAVAARGGGAKRVLASPPDVVVKPPIPNFELPPGTPIDASIEVEGPPLKRMRHKQRNLKRSLSFSSEHKDAVSSIARMRVLRDLGLQAQSSSSGAQALTSGVSSCTDVVSGTTGLPSASSSYFSPHACSYLDKFRQL